MFYKHLVTDDNGKSAIYLYLTNNYEISSDMYVVKDNNSIMNSAKNYLDTFDISYKGRDIYLVVNDVIVGRLQLKDFLKKPKYIEYVRFGKTYRMEFLDSQEYPSIKFVDVRRSSGILERMKMGEYLFGVVAREMPFIENKEMLKAQAVLARTYLLKMLERGENIKETNKYQLYFDKGYLRLLWKDKFKEYRDKIIDAILETSREVLKYNGEYIECFTHYQNVGRTEDAETILKLSYPYLVSVDSYEDNSKSLVRYRKVSNEYLSNLLNMEIYEGMPLKILKSSSAYNVIYIQFGNKVFDGLILARKLGLISNSYTVEVGRDFTTFLTKGCGHALGLSKCGAKVMAESGYTYQQILSHYYPNTRLLKTSESTL